MTPNQLSDKAIATIQFLASCPPTIEQGLLADKSFVEEFEIPTTSRIKIGDFGPVFDQDKLFGAVASFTNNEPQPDLVDSDGNVWKIQKGEADGDDDLKITFEERSYSIHQMRLLTPDTGLRQHQLEKDQQQAQFPSPEFDKLLEIVEARPLTEHEFLDYSEAITQTPLSIANAISAAMRRGDIDNSVLAPTSEDYWKRLLGVYDPCTTEQYLENFEGIARTLYPSLGQIDRLRMLLHYGAHNRLTPDFAIIGASLDELDTVVKSLLNEGDVLSIVSAVLGLIPMLDEFKEAKAWISSLYEKILPARKDDYDEAFRFLSAFTMFVYVELVNHDALKEYPPSLRRHAALTQASLIEKSAKMNGVDLERFAEHATKLSGFSYWVAALCDAREEPLWYADLIDSSQLARECAVRIHQVAVAHKELVEEHGLTELLMTDQKPWMGPSEVMLAILPGPMEGLRVQKNPLPDDFYNAIKKSLTDKTITDRSFIAIVNTALIHDIPNDLVQLAVDALRRQDRLIVPENANSSLAGLYRGLARLAAATRSIDLAEDIFVALRQHLSRFPDDFDPANFLEAGLTACAAYEEADQWREATGRFFTDLGFRSNNEELNGLSLATINCLVRLDRELWISCGKAQATFSSMAI